MANNLVTEAYLAANFAPKSGVTPGTDDHAILNCNEILARYNVTISPSTGNFCPKQSELTAIITQAAIATLEATYGVFKDRFMVYGDVVSDGGGTITWAAIFASTSPTFDTYYIVYAPTFAQGVFYAFFEYNPNDGVGGFIRPGTTYYYKAVMMINGVDIYEGVVRQVSTEQGSPNVGTYPAYNVGSTYASAGALNAQNGGSPAITAKGILYVKDSIAATPTFAHNVLNLAAGAGTELGTMTGLEPNTKYNFRSFATNSLGTDYGSTFSFTTLP